MRHFFNVTGMTCGHCENAISRAVERVDSNAKVRINRAEKTVEIFSEKDRECLAKAITDEGYTVSPG